jgi:outer membrane receptor protein involved in Fe transport
VKSYSIGSDIRIIEGSDYGYIFSDQTGSIKPVRTDIGRGKQLFTGGFGQVSLDPIQKLDVMFSARYQYYKSFDSYQRNATSDGNVPSHETYSFLPRLSLRYRLTPQFALRAAGYEAFRAPTEDQLYRSIVTSTGAFLANARLFPEKLKGGEAGFDVDFGRFTGQVTGFYNHIDNLLTSRNLTPAELPAGAFFGSQNINAGSGESRGMELEAHYRIRNGLTAILGYTYADSPVTSNNLDPASVGLQQIMVPHHKVTLSVNYVGENGWRITPQVRYLSKQWGDSDHTLPIDGHFVADLTGSYPVTRRIEAFGELQNLFNKRYIGYNDGASPPILGEPLTVFAGLRIHLY